MLYQCLLNKSNFRKIFLFKDFQSMRSIINHVRTIPHSYRSCSETHRLGLLFTHVSERFDPICVSEKVRSQKWFNLYRTAIKPLRLSAHNRSKAERNKKFYDIMWTWSYNMVVFTFSRQFCNRHHQFWMMRQNYFNNYGLQNIGWCTFCRVA